MKIAFDPDMIKNLSLRDMVYKVNELGYKHIELSPRADFLPFYKHPKAYKGNIQEFKKALKETGVEVSSMIPIYRWSGPDRERQEAAVRNWKRAIEVAVELSVNVMNTELSGDPHQPEICEEMFYRSMEELLPIFEREGIRLDIQSHPYDFCENHYETVDLVRSFNSESVKYLYCAAHTFFYDNGIGDVGKMLDYAGDTLSHVIIADTYNHTLPCRYIVNPPGVSATVHQHTSIGEGEVDFDTLFSKLREMKFDGIASVSLFGFPEKLQQISDNTLARVKKELLVK